MRRSIAASLLAASSVTAFSDSSPFVLLSSVQLPSAPSTDQIQSSTEVLSTVKQLLASCPTDRYLLVSQPNAHASDLLGPSGCQSKTLCNAVKVARVQTKSSEWSVSEVIGNLSFDDFANYIKTVCLKLDRRVTVDERVLPALPSGADAEARAKTVNTNDKELDLYLEKARDAGDYTLIYFSNPNEFKSYEATFDDASSVELKRDTVFLESTKPHNATRDNRPLFEKYQFFTPGIFMGFLVLFIILMILYSGLAGLASLEVPYGAFEKEMGPSAQKKSG